MRAGAFRAAVDSSEAPRGGVVDTPSTLQPYSLPGAGRARRMAFYADLHVHSKYSRATSRNCDLEHLALWARKKGIAIVGTGDFTHPRLESGAQGEARPRGAGSLPPAAGPRTVRRGTAPGRLPERADRHPVHAVGGDLHHLQEVREDPEDPSPHLHPRLRGHGAGDGEPCPGRQPPLRRAADPGARLPAPAGDHPRVRPPVPIWSPPTSGPRGSPPSARSRASTPSTTATETSRPTSSRSRPACPPIRR